MLLYLELPRVAQAGNYWIIDMLNKLSICPTGRCYSILGNLPYLEGTIPGMLPYLEGFISGMLPNLEGTIPGLLPYLEGTKPAMLPYLEGTISGMLPYLEGTAHKGWWKSIGQDDLVGCGQVLSLPSKNVMDVEQSINQPAKGKLFLRIFLKGSKYI